jgi:hypothetical protein
VGHITIKPVLKRVDPLLKESIELSAREFDALVSFVRDGLLDKRAKPDSLCALIPKNVPSGNTTMDFEGCPKRR